MQLQGSVSGSSPAGHTADTYLLTDIAINLKRPSIFKSNALIQTDLHLSQLSSWVLTPEPSNSSLVILGFELKTIWSVVQCLNQWDTTTIYYITFYFTVRVYNVCPCPQSWSARWMPRRLQAWRVGRPTLWLWMSKGRCLHGAQASGGSSGSALQRKLSEFHGKRS